MGQPDQGAQGRGGGQVDQGILVRSRVPSARSHRSQTSGASRRSRQSCAGVTRVAQNRARHAGCGRSATTRGATRAPAGPRPGAGVDSGDVRGQRGPRARATVGAGGAGATRVGVRRRSRVWRTRRRHRAAGRDASVAPQRSALADSASPSTAVTVIRSPALVAARSARVAISGAHACAGIRARVHCVGRQPRLGQIQRRAEHHARAPRPQRDRHGRLGSWRSCPTPRI